MKCFFRLCTLLVIGRLCGESVDRVKSCEIPYTSAIHLFSRYTRKDGRLWPDHRRSNLFSLSLERRVCFCCLRRYLNTTFSLWDNFRFFLSVFFFQFFSLCPRSRPLHCALVRNTESSSLPPLDDLLLLLHQSLFHTPASYTINTVFLYQVLPPEMFVSKECGCHHT